MIKKLVFLMVLITGCTLPPAESGIEPVTVSQDTRKLTNTGLIDFGLGQFAVNGVIYNFGNEANNVPVLDANGKLNPSLIPTSVSSFSGEFVDLMHLPNTISGYGIIDFNTLGDARWSLSSHTHNFASITFKPNTLSGYGITDGQPLSAGLTALATVSGTFGTNAIYYRSGLNTWTPVTLGANMVFDSVTGILSSTASGTGGGTVSAFSSGGLNPFFSTSVDTADTTPALHFSLLDAPANSLLGAVGAGAPSYLSSANARLALGATTVGQNLMLLGNPGAVTFLKVNSDNTVTARSAVNFKTDLGLNLVENTALSTWGGSSTITQLGTIASGVWNGTPVADAYIASAATWNAKQSTDAKLTAFVGLTGVVADRIPYFTGSSTMGLATFTAQARLLLDDTDAATMRATLGLGTLSTQNGTFSGTSSGTNTGDQSLFGTIAVAGQSSITPNSTNTTLTLAAGSNMTLTTNTSTRTVTLSAASGGSGGNVATDTIFDVKGDLVAGTGSNISDRVAVGTNGQFLSADSTKSTGVAWVTPQIDSIVDSTTGFTLSFNTSGMTANSQITPALSASSVTVTPATAVSGYAVTGIDATGTITTQARNATNAPATTIASAGTIAPVNFITFISGTSAISTITVPSYMTGKGGQFVIIPTGAWTFNTAGNIALASTAVANKAMTVTYDGTTGKFYPSY